MVFVDEFVPKDAQWTSVYKFETSELDKVNEALEELQKGAE